MGKPDKFDFGGWATKYNIKCSDDRTIMKDAFKHLDGKTVPLVWGHQHNEPANILGHAILESREEGVYTYGVFNDTESGKDAKALVQHGDITALSIYANKLKEQARNVIHGMIREVSLVISGANVGAAIETVVAHSDDADEQAIIYTGEEFELIHSDEEDSDDFEDESEDDVAEHADNEDETIEDIFKTLTEKQQKVVYALIAQALEEQETDAKHSDEGTDKDATISDVFETLTDVQKQAVYAMIGEALEHSETPAAKEDPEDKSDDTLKHSDTNNNTNNEGDNTMKKNLFEGDAAKEDETKVLTHDEMKAIFSDIKRCGTLKEAALEHGITDIEYLFPEARTLDTPPSLISREMTWVTKMMNGVHKTPFSRIKSIFADITADDARARGYIKGNLKVEEVFTLLKRTTTPVTVYKKQKLDRDDIIDITDFDVVSWQKSEMRLMLDEELARAFLVGDGRLSSSDDKVNEQNIRPIWTDADLFTIKKNVVIDALATADQASKAFIRACVKTRKLYKGSGNPTLYTTEDVLTDCLLMEDTTGRIIYESAEKLAAAIRVKEIVTVPVMENLARLDDNLGMVNLMGIIVNLNDYNVGADKGGAINMFEDFDIDYNAQKYLIETRCSGALTKPYSAIALETAYVRPQE